MLVLSRRPDEKIVLPSLGITLHVVSTRYNAVRLGIDAPPGVKILRGELLDAGAQPGARDSPEGRGPPAPVPEPKHALCNRLNRLSLALHLFKRQWRAGLTSQADATLRQALEALESLEGGGRVDRPQPAPIASTRARCRTLVVEDDSNERALLAGLLSLHGCECGTAADGLDALAYLEANERPDVVLLGMGLPRCSGPEALGRIRQNPRYHGLKVFAMSSSSADELGVPTGPAGADAWFSKPLNPGRLWEAIQQLVAN